MNESGFVRKREADWRRLTELTDKASSPRRLTDEELDEFVRLYRAASSDLALARTQSTNEALTGFLNDQVARAYAAIYTVRRRPFFPTLAGSVAVAARTIRKRWAFIFVSASIFFGSWFGYFGLLTVRPDLKVAMANPETDMFDDMWKKGLPTDRSTNDNLSMWSMYAANNPKVAVIATASSVATFGIMTVYLLGTNGMLVGQLMRSEADIHQAPFLLGSIFPHSVPELSGIIVSGAAGFVLGWALINPGRRTRGAALREAARDAAVMILTAVTLMFIAAPIEAFFSYNVAIPLYVKFAVGSIEVLGWGIVWTTYGRLPDGSDPSDPSWTPTSQASSASIKAR